MFKCHNCKGKGVVKSMTNPNLSGRCYYCNGTGMRKNRYKRYGLVGNTNK